MSLVFATRFFLFFCFFCILFGGGGGGGLLRHLAVQTDFEFEISGPLVPSRVSFRSMTSDPRVHAGGRARGQNLVHLQKLGLSC